ncbi:hypothetical protein G9E11_18890 [Arthrobacter sp. IA7]|uniref:hypothetical protein n=1 Tax=Arthrobacter ipis TaxID=2716202 RepID=UPI001685DCEA|nr:hypothetical protein [Arthrobacter ipis]MBD1544268.1 hypothetical protein [Arthrobacter ipis]
MSSTFRAPVPSPMSPWAVKWTAAGPAGEEGPTGLGDAIARPDVPGEAGAPNDDGGGGAGGPDWHAVSSSASAIESTAGATPDHLRCFHSPVMIPHTAELSLMPPQAGEQ